MANKRRLTDEERAQRIKESKRKYYNDNKDKYSKCHSIAVTTDERAAQLELLRANGYKNAGDFWRYCIKLLAAGQLPTDSAGGIVSTDTQTQNPNN